MPNVSTQFMDDLGPLAALWAGQNQGMDENTKLVNQQNALEQIANSQQTRDIQKQKLPFEMSALEHTQRMQPHLLGEQETKTAAAKQKLNKDQFDAFFGQFKEVLPTLQGTPADGAVLAEIAKRNGMDPSDSRIGKMIAVGSSGNRAAIDEMLKRIALMSEKSIQERARQGDVDAAHMDRTKLEQKSAGERNAATNAAGLERAKISAKARADASEKKQTIDQLAKGDPVRTQTLLVQEAQRQAKLGNTDEANELYAMANEPTLVAKVINQQAQRAQTTLTTDASGNTSLGTAGGTVPIPKAVPRTANPAAAQGATSMPPGHEGQPANPAERKYTPAEAKNLPKGTKFMGTNGKMYEVQ